MKSLIEQEIDKAIEEYSRQLKDCLLYGCRHKEHNPDPNHEPYGISILEHNMKVIQDKLSYDRVVGQMIIR